MQVFIFKLQVDIEAQMLAQMEEFECKFSGLNTRLC